MEYETPANRPTSPIRFIIIGIILAVLLLVGLYFGKQFVNSRSISQPRVATSETAKKKETTTTEKDAATKEQQAKQVQEKAAAEEVKKAEDAKKKQEEQAASQAREQAQAAQPQVSSQPGGTLGNTQAPQVAVTGPSEVASTGPAEVIGVLLGVIALSYGAFSFIRSRRQLARITKHTLLT